MLNGRILFSGFAASLAALVSVGCFGGKNKDIADAPPPPPAAYPDTSGGADAAYPGGMGAPALSPVGTTAAATISRSAPTPPAPVPFELRDGETLVTHQIASGENLSVIATKYNTTVGRILSANGMTDSRIYAGKTLQVPTSAPPTNLAQNTTANATTTAPTPSMAGSGGLSRGSYPAIANPPTTSPAPVAPSVPTSIVPPSASGAIAPPPLPPGASAPSAPSIQPPGYPATTSYPRTAPTPPSFDASRVQFSN